MTMKQNEHREGMKKFMDQQQRLTSARNKSQMKKARSMQRTNPGSAQHKRECADIEEYLSKNPPRTW